MPGGTSPSIREVSETLNALRAVLDELRTDYNVHTHNAQTGGGNSGAPNLLITTVVPEAVPQSVGTSAASVSRANSYDDFAKQVNDLRALATELRTDYNAHTHGGVTAGGGNTTGVSASVTATVPSKLPEPLTD